MKKENDIQASKYNEQNQINVYEIFSFRKIRNTMLVACCRSFTRSPELKCLHAQACACAHTRKNKRQNFLSLKETTHLHFPMISCHFKNIRRTFFIPVRNTVFLWCFQSYVLFKTYFFYSFFFYFSSFFFSISCFFFRFPCVTPSIVSFLIVFLNHFS